MIREFEKRLSRVAPTMSDAPLLTVAEWQIVLQALDVLEVTHGNDEETRRRAKRKVAAALELAQRPPKETTA